MAATPDRDREGLIQVEQHLEVGEWAKAGELCHKKLMAKPEDPETLFWMARVLCDTNKPAIAHPIAKQLVRLAPKRWGSWFILGAVEAYLQRYTQSRKALQKALKMRPNHPETLRLYANALVMLFDWNGMKYAHKSLEMEDHHQAHTVLAFGYLHQRQWAKGWAHYREQLGHVEFRDEQDFGLPEWRGEDGKVLVYAEQGLGDQLAYLSALKPHQLTCHPKLKNLLARTFPEVHGDQFAEVVKWPIHSEYQTSMASAMQYIEMKPRGKYLIPCPKKTAYWAEELGRLGGKRKIGIGWTGGQIGSHGWQGRNLTLDQLKPILDLDATFISLEYRETPTPNWIYDFPEATRTDDYDDTAALVANLDAVVCVPTTVYHLAGALGIPAHVLVHDKPHFHEGVSGDCPWWETVKFYRRRDLGTEKAIECVATSLSQ